MKLIHLGTLLFFVIATLVSLHASNAFAGDRELLEFKTQYPDAAQRLSHAYSRLHLIAWTKKSAGGRELKQRQENRYEVFAQGKLAKVALTKFREGDGDALSPTTESVVVLGDRYAFRLQKDIRNGGGYTVLGFEKPGQDHFDEMSTQFIAAGGGLARAPFASDQLSMLELLNTKVCRIISVDPVAGQLERALRVKFTDSGNGPTRFSGSADFLPNRAWALSRWEFDASSSVKTPKSPVAGTIRFTASSSIEYRQDGNAIPVISRIEKSDQQGAGRVFEVEKVEFDTTTSESQFTLRFFGLPDLADPIPPPSQNHAIYWILAAAVLMTLAAIMLRRSSHR
jgi:hypothetical protein